MASDGDRPMGMRLRIGEQDQCDHCGNSNDDDDYRCAVVQRCFLRLKSHYRLVRSRRQSFNSCEARPQEWTVNCRLHRELLSRGGQGKGEQHYQRRQNSDSQHGSGSISQVSDAPLAPWHIQKVALTAKLHRVYGLGDQVAGERAE